MFNLVAGAEIVEENPDNKQEVIQFSSLIKRNIFRILSITDSMLKYGNPNSHSTVPIDINHLLQEILSLINGKCHKNRIKVQTDFGELSKIKGDLNSLHQVFMNITMNAIQAMENGGNMLITTQNEVPMNGNESGSKGISIRISDTGCGISDETLEKIYDPFFTTKYEGTGLGLSIALKNIASFDGLFEIKSTEGKGTTFQIFIPLKNKVPA
jgi:signal transduction histidine kinase